MKSYHTFCIYSVVKKNILILLVTLEELEIVNMMPKAKLLQHTTVDMKHFPTTTSMYSWSMLPQKDLLLFLAMHPDGVSTAEVFLMDVATIATSRLITPFR